MNCQLFLVLSILSASQAVPSWFWGNADKDVLVTDSTDLSHLARIMDSHRPSTSTIVWESSSDSASTSAPSSTPSAPVTEAPVTGTNTTKSVASTTPFEDKKDMDKKGVKGSESTSTTPLPEVTSTSTMATTEAAMTVAATVAATTVAKAESVESLDSWEHLSDNEIEAEEEKFFNWSSEESKIMSSLTSTNTSSTTSMSTSTESTESTTSAPSEAEAEVTTSPVSTTSEAVTSTTKSTITTTSRPTTTSAIPKSNVVPVIPVIAAPKSSSATSVSFLVSLGLFLAAVSALL